MIWETAQAGNRGSWRNSSAYERVCRFERALVDTRTTNRPSRVTRPRVITIAITYLVLILFAVIFVGPFVWMVSTSLKVDTQIFSEKVQWIPHPAVWKNYPDALGSFPFLL